MLRSFKCAVYQCYDNTWAGMFILKCNFLDISLRVFNYSGYKADLKRIIKRAPGAPGGPPAPGAPRAPGGAGI
jgi:hypothetical protein